MFGDAEIETLFTKLLPRWKEHVCQPSRNLNGYSPISFTATILRRLAHTPLWFLFGGTIF